MSALATQLYGRRIQGLTFDFGSLRELTPLVVWRSLSGWAACSELCELSLQLPIALPLNRRILDHLARAWPRLENVSLLLSKGVTDGYRWDWLAFLGGRWHKLRQLTICLDAHGPPPAQSPPTTLQTLAQAHILCQWQFIDTREVAPWLAAVFSIGALTLSPDPYSVMTSAVTACWKAAL